MRFVGAIGLTLLLVAATHTLAAEWDSRVLVNATIGDADQEYGYEGARLGSDGNMIGGYVVTHRGVYIYDGLRGEVKVYSIKGGYLGVIEARRTAGSTSIPLTEAVDITVADGRIYVLCDFGTEEPRWRVYKFDAQSGEALGVKHVAVAKLGTMVQRINGRDQRVPIEGSVMLAGAGDAIDIFDQVANQSYPVVRGGRFVQAVIEDDALPGRAFGSDRIRQTGQAATELLDPAGKRVRVLAADGSLIAVDGTDRIFAVTRRGDDGFDIVVHDASGEVLGTVMPPKRKWRVAAMPNTYQIYEVVAEDAGAALYEIYANDDTVQLIRWGGR